MTRARRVALLALFLGGGAIVAVLEFLAPRDRDVRVRLETPASVAGLELRWLDGDDGDVLGASRWSFTGAGAPRELAAKVRARRGTLRLQLDVKRRDASEDRTEQRVLVGSGSSLVVSVP